jgi:hypothetical protein
MVAVCSLITAYSLRRYRRVLVCRVHHLKAHPWSQAPVILAVWDIVSIQEDFLEQPSNIAVVWPLFVFQAVGILEQRVKYFC